MYTDGAQRPNGPRPCGWATGASPDVLLDHTAIPTMSAVVEAVQALEGKVEVESELGSFTKFTVQFPLKPVLFEAQYRELELNDNA